MNCKSERIPRSLLSRGRLSEPEADWQEKENLSVCGELLPDFQFAKEGSWHAYSWAKIRLYVR